MSSTRSPIDTCPYRSYVAQLDEFAPPLLPKELKVTTKVHPRAENTPMVVPASKPDGVPTKLTKRLHVPLRKQATSSGKRSQATSSRLANQVAETPQQPIQHRQEHEHMTMQPHKAEATVDLPRKVYFPVRGPSMP